MTGKVMVMGRTINFTIDLGLRMVDRCPQKVQKRNLKIMPGDQIDHM